MRKTKKNDEEGTNVLLLSKTERKKKNHYKLNFEYFKIHKFT